MQKGVKISGCIFANEGDLDNDNFTDAFIEWIESKGWQFGGGTSPIEDHTDDEHE